MAWAVAYTRRVHLFLTLKEWLRKCLGMRRFYPLTPAPVLLLSLLLLPGLTGKLWRTSMCLYTSTPSLSPLMRPHTSDFFLQLLPPIPVPWPSPLLCPMLATGSMAFHRLFWVSISRIGSFDAVFSTGWEFFSTAPPTPVQNVTALQTSLETTKLDVEGMEIGSCDTMPSGTSSSLPPSLLLWPLPLNSPTSFLIPSPDQLISTSLPGAVVVLLHWMCTIYLLSSSRPWVRLPSPQATLCRLVSNGSSPLICLTVGQRDWSSSLLCLRLWGVLQRTPFPALVDLRTGPQDASVCSKQLFHRAAIALWRGNAGLWLHCQPSLPPSVDGLV